MTSLPRGTYHPIKTGKEEIIRLSTEMRGRAIKDSKERDLKKYQAEMSTSNRLYKQNAEQHI